MSFNRNIGDEKNVNKTIATDMSGKSMPDTSLVI